MYQSDAKNVKNVEYKNVYERIILDYFQLERCNDLLRI